jgi:lipopolysaccharide transport system ATP-binding protein
VAVDLDGQQPDLSLNIELILLSTGRHKTAFVAVDILNSAGSAIMQALPTREPFISSAPGLHRIELLVQLPPLIPGTYTLTVWTGSHNTETLDIVENCTSFNIETSPTEGRTYPHTADHGYIVPKTTLNYTTI